MFKIIVAGCGGIVNAWFRNALARDDVEIVALVDPVEANAENHKLRHQLDGCPIFPTIGEALEKVDANLVFNTTPPANHEEVIVSSLRKGLDVFSEKPLADTIGAARNIVKASDESGRVCSVMQNRRYLNGIRTYRAEIERDAVGKPYHMSVDMLLGAYFTGFRNEMDHPLLVDMSIHTFDEARYLLGEAKAVSAYCQEHNPPHSRYRGAAGADCIFEMDNGMILTFKGSWASRSENTSSHGRWRLACAGGAATWDGYDGVVLNEAQPVPENIGYLEEEGLRREVALQKEGREGHDGCLDDMFSALAGRRPMQTDCHNNIHSLAMMLACVESAETGKKVKL
ncbi:MAG: Gfo/Idh/MocA family oxidoreductase [Oscillospiraceae bacterium]|nr:Gfo/Idh/MocA family oxidoreductase [Oscillospiraceae bacterium]